ncbi:helix-turn-helix transcriptional regulator [Radicibacter daui]|uniref:helix-turn-helix transcriptional regulator n=1 Tax=Radicibacter daui TaxID=3064829 RepID=UPI004046A0C9
MTPGGLKRWRKSLDLSQKDAAHALGLKRRVIQYYEKGERDGDKLEIPLYVRLACYALTAGVRDYSGPEEQGRRKEARQPEVSPVAEPAAEAETPVAAVEAAPKKPARKSAAKSPAKKAAPVAAEV